MFRMISIATVMAGTLAVVVGSAHAQDPVKINCWDSFPTQVNTVNGGPFHDSRQGSCPLNENYVRVVEGQTEGYCEVTFRNLPPLTCFDVDFEYLNDGMDGGRIDLSANGRPIGSIQGTGPHDFERCEIITFHNIALYTNRMTVRIDFHELSTTQFRHNGAVSLTFRPSERQPLQLAVTGDTRPGGIVNFSVQADPSCEALLGYYLAASKTAVVGTTLSDGRIFPLDSPMALVTRGTLDYTAHGTGSFELPHSHSIIGRTYYFSFVTFLPPGTEAGTVGRFCAAVGVTVTAP
ncbi:MAG: hypothetical protein HYR85_27720 [Planctomycetes bacterium]|nr:hypothetical protein [Planctomycetota bacterium]MBI3844230.1 hypothetical protein [Planctomycetota bacterium]